MEKKVQEAQDRINQRNTDWATRARTAASNVEDATRRYTGEPPATGLPEGMPKGSKPIGKDKVTGKTVYEAPGGKRFIAD
jgi:hypothetical protein